MEEYLSERERWEELKTWLRSNGPSIVAGVALAAVGVAGWRWWQAHSEEKAVAAATRYEQLMQAYEAGDRAKSVAIIDELRRNYSSSPYADQAALMSARVHVDANELDAAAKSLQDVMDHSRDKQLQVVARLRLARVQLAQKKYDEALAALSGAQPGAFAPRFEEVRGDVLLARGDKTAALKAYQTAKAAVGSGVVDGDLLDLKINDLMTASTQTPAAAKVQ